MTKKIMNAPLLHEEKLAVKWFLTIFMLIAIAYDFIFYFIYKKFVLNIEPGLPNDFGYVFYLCLFITLFVAYLLSRRGKTYLIKYLFFFTYIVLSIIYETITYSGSTMEYQSGNAVEVIIILFSPMFVNTRFFYTASIGMITKYLLVGFIIQSTMVIVPIFLVGVLSILAFILLKRFQGYVVAIKTSYSTQFEGIVNGVIATIELKDPYTKGHSERVAKYATILANEAKVFDKYDYDSFRYACLLHDIGKVNIPDEILMKPTRLTADEFNVIKTHPWVGAEAIKKVQGLGEEYVDVIHYHHERWDGKGYPQQLKGNDIPYLARIVSVADAFDAMTSSRSYRAALPVEEAYNRIIEGQGTQFDPELVELFKRIYPDWVKFQQSYEFPLELESKAKEVRT